MKKGLLKVLNKIIALVAIAFIFTTTFVNSQVFALGNHLDPDGTPIDISQVSLSIDFSNVEIKEGATITTVPIQLENGHGYSITYLDAVDYYGDKLSLKVDVSVPDTGIKNTNDGEFSARNIVKLDANNRVDVYLNSTTKNGTGKPYNDGQQGFGDNATEANITFTFLNDQGQATAFTGLIGIEDIDGSDYLFDNSANRTIYYIDAAGDDHEGHENPNSHAKDHFYVNADGIKRDRNPSDDDYVGSYDNAKIYIPLNGESTFNFGFKSRSDEIIMPMVYTWKYTINYNKNAVDATGTMDSHTYTNSDATMYSRPNAFSREGYRFIGFTLDTPSYDPATSTLYTEPTDFKNTLIGKGAFGEITLYAQWEPTYAIKYDKNATDAIGSMDDNVFNQDANPMASAEEWKFSRPGYEFIGFKVEDNDPLIGKNDKGDYSYDYRTELLADPDRVITLFAQWNPLPYKLKYNANGGTGEMDDTDFLGSDLTMYSTDDWTFQREGYNFVGYKVENEGEILSPEPRDFKKELLDDEDRVITLYAQWDPIKYNVVFDPNEPMAGSVKETMTDHLNILFDTTYNLNKNVYTAEGYSWVGWNLNPDRSGRPFTDEEAFKNLTNKDGDTVTLYAQWEPWKYTIRYDGNGGVGNMPDQVYTYFDLSMKSKENQFDAGGFRFIGFDYYDKDGNKFRITSPSELRQVLIDLGPNSVLTLVAQWEKIEYQETPYRLPMTGIE